MFQVGQLVKRRSDQFSLVGRVTRISSTVCFDGSSITRRPIVFVNWSGSWTDGHDEDALVPTNQVRVLTRRVEACLR